MRAGLVLYLHTSSLLKLLLPEPESLRVCEAIAGEKDVLVSALVELEAEVQLRGGWLGGAFTRTQYRRMNSPWRSRTNPCCRSVRPRPGIKGNTTSR